MLQAYFRGITMWSQLRFGTAVFSLHAAQAHSARYGGNASAPEQPSVAEIQRIVQIGSTLHDQYAIRRNVTRQEAIEDSYKSWHFALALHACLLQHAADICVSTRTFMQALARRHGELAGHSRTLADQAADERGTVCAPTATCYCVLERSKDLSTRLRALLRQRSALNAEGAAALARQLDPNLLANELRDELERRWRLALDPTCAAILGAVFAQRITHTLNPTRTAGHHE